MWRLQILFVAHVFLITIPYAFGEFVSYECIRNRHSHHSQLAGKIKVENH